MHSQEMSLDEAIKKYTPENHLVTRKVFARGVQAYEWRENERREHDWRPMGPLADLYALDANSTPLLGKKIGTHYMHLEKPAWEFEDGRLIANKIEPQPGAGPKDVDWLLVELDKEHRMGLNYSHVLRLKTQLGQKPDKDIYPGGYVGHRRGMSYTAFYVFLQKGS